MDFFNKKPNLTHRKIILLGSAQATGTLLYVLFAAAVLIFLIPALAELFPEKEISSVDFVLVSGFIMFFITSASITGILVFGYPAILALRQQLKEAILLITITISIVILFILILAIILGVLAITV